MVARKVKRLSADDKTASKVQLGAEQARSHGHRALIYDPAFDSFVAHVAMDFEAPTYVPYDPIRARLGTSV